MKSKVSIPVFLACLIGPLAVGGLAGFATRAAIQNWYVFLNKPDLLPPNSWFGPVWTLLYLLMGLSLFLVLHQLNYQNYKSALKVFLIQLCLNFFWSFLFFKFNLLGIALIEIVLLWISILMMIVHFYRITPIAGLLNIPYLLWVSFATYLNAGVYYLN